MGVIGVHSISHQVVIFYPNSESKIATFSTHCKWKIGLQISLSAQLTTFRSYFPHPYCFDRLTFSWPASLCLNPPPPPFAPIISFHCVRFQGQGLPTLCVRLENVRELGTCFSLLQLSIYFGRGESSFWRGKVVNFCCAKWATLVVKSVIASLKIIIIVIVVWNSCVCVFFFISIFL